MLQLEGITLPCGDYLFGTCLSVPLFSRPWDPNWMDSAMYSPSVRPQSSTREVDDFTSGVFREQFNGGVQRWRCFYGRFNKLGENSMLTKYLDFLLCLPHQKLARIKVRCSVRLTTKCIVSEISCLFWKHTSTRKNSQGYESPPTLFFCSCIDCIVLKANKKASRGIFRAGGALVGRLAEIRWVTWLESLPKIPVIFKD